jgi:hypothetical protein
MVTLWHGEKIVSASMDPHTWTQDTTLYLLATIGYTNSFYDTGY